jgi:hypothetical protein
LRMTKKPACSASCLSRDGFTLLRKWQNVNITQLGSSSLGSSVDATKGEETGYSIHARSAG